MNSRRPDIAPVLREPHRAVSAAPLVAALRSCTFRTQAMASACLALLLLAQAPAEAGAQEYAARLAYNGDIGLSCGAGELAAIETNVHYPTDSSLLWVRHAYSYAVLVHIPYP